MDKDKDSIKKQKTIVHRKKVYIVNKENYKKLDLNKIANKKSIIVSTKEALEDVTPVNWSDIVLSGKKKIIIEKN
ncbi:MAG: hypothetical protein APF77_13745 [Clostridia bacterium BRH_c25]|nr:MAG: hypothetical protein APF77_13745 [Clostridia bacterium BRH_c25]